MSMETIEGDSIESSKQNGNGISGVSIQKDASVVLDISVTRTPQQEAIVDESLPSSVPPLDNTMIFLVDARDNKVSDSGKIKSLTTSIDHTFSPVESTHKPQELVTESGSNIPVKTEIMIDPDNHQNDGMESMEVSKTEDSEEFNDLAIVEEKRNRGEKRKHFTDNQPYVQRRACGKAAHRLPKCRECQISAQSGIKYTDIVCRFQSFRKLEYRAGVKNVAGFCDPDKDPDNSDRNLWLPNKENPPEGLELELCKLLITQLGDQLCELLHQENEAIEIRKDLGDKGRYWKRVVEGVREMCDVCATTVFNFHWTCNSCGFMACAACCKARKNHVVKTLSRSEKDNKIKDEYHWLYCTKGFQVAHNPDDLSLTQIIPGKVLDNMTRILHQVRSQLKIPQMCGCAEAEKYAQLNNKLTETTEAAMVKTSPVGEPMLSKTPVDVKTKNGDGSSSGSDSESDDSEEEPCFYGALANDNQCNNKDITAPNQSIDQPVESKDDIAKESGDSSDKNTNLEEPKHAKQELKHYVRVQKTSYYDKAQLCSKVCQMSVTKDLYPSLPHMWLCSGALLRLLDPSHEDNYALFKDLWQRGQPVLVSNVGQKLNKRLWSPEAFIEDFGHKKNDLVNCMTGKVVPGQPMRKFWEGFEDVSKRIKDENGVPMLLKLKDWPPGDDFAKLLPDRFDDLMAALPLKDYTHRTGRLNLAARLPNNFMKPDLGPKMYIAYGDGTHLEKGTTNLHLDISDAVNCMVYVGVPKNCDTERHNKAVMDAIKDSDCDKKTKLRVMQDKELPGALWHIYRPWDADKIRDLLNKVSVEAGHAIEPHHDPIHDQVAYLDKALRKRLREEYNVVGFPIVQCEGDAVFIPAGAPHQVRNLHNCIKIAEDFVSPENVSHCFQLTEEFRNLTETHTNHEDKLQIKNIVYHGVKDALSVLLHAMDSDKTNANNDHSTQ